jgi:hypothetical protein
MEHKMSEGTAWNQGELSEETRKLVLERTDHVNHTMAMFGLIDDIMAISKNPHASIIRRLRTMKNQLSLNDPMPLYDVTTLDQAIKALEAHS